MRMKILLISGTYPPDKCGVGDYASKLYDSLLNTNSCHDIYLLSSNRLLKNGEHIPLKSLSWNFFGIRQIINIIKCINPNVINFQFPTISYRFSISVLYLTMRLKKLGFRTVTTLHEYSYSPKLAQIRTRFIVRSSYRVIVVDEQYKSDILDLKLLKRQDVLFIPIGSNIEPSKLNIEGIQSLRGRYISDDGMLIGYFGFIFPAKGVESLIKLGEILKKQKRNFKIIVAAELNEKNAYHRSILKMITVSKLEKELILTGYLPSNEIADLLKSMDVVIFPFTKGFSTKNGSVLAALSQGINVISTKSERFQNSPYEQLHLIDHYSSIEQIVDIIDHQLKYNVTQQVVTWEEIGDKTINFLINSAENEL